MECLQLSIPGLWLFKPKAFNDERGYFLEFYNQNLKEIIGDDFVQDNESGSKKNVLRGLHFQLPPFAQGKLIRVVRGTVFDVAVDLRRGSPYYGKFHAEILSGENKHIFWIPEGFAHGFLALEDDTIVSYKVTAPYCAELDRCLLWNDPAINIPWPCDNPILSFKDSQGILLKDFDTPFRY
jgi:dTDP-4-dehydrorhamnose 3,5-epimerase